MKAESRVPAEQHFLIPSPPSRTDRLAFIQVMPEMSMLSKQDKCLTKVGYQIAPTKDDAGREMDVTCEAMSKCSEMTSE